MAAPCGQDQGTCLFAADGSLFAADAGRNGQIKAFDSSGRIRPGWPIDAPSGANYSGGVGHGWQVALDGSLLVTTSTGITDIDQSGQVRPGWPVALAEGNSQILVEPSGTIAVVRDNPAADEAWVYALTLAGNAPVVWSTRMSGDVSDATVAPDGTIFLASADRGGGLGGTRFAVSTLDSDGKLIAGWSTSLWNAMVMTPSGDLAVVAYDSRANAAGTAYDILRTHLSVLDRTGNTPAGWPRIINGPASVPAVGPDGAMYLIQGETVSTGSVLALDRSGQVEPGWPVSLPAGYAGVAGDRTSGRLNVSLPPIVANGLVYVAASSQTSGRSLVSAFRVSGSDHTGWAYQVPTDSQFTGPMWTPVFASPAGVLYVLEQTSPSSGAVVALGTDGRTLPGWPYVFSPGPGGLTFLADGGVGIYSMDFATRLTASGSPAS